MKRQIIYNSEYIFSMTERRSDLAAKLEDTTRPLVRHLIKLYLYPEASDVNHWRQEVYEFLHNVPKLRNTKKFPTQEFILKNTIQIDSELISIWVQHIIKDYRDLDESPQVDVSELTQNIFSYYDWLAYELSRYGEVARSDVYEKLESLSF